MDIRVEGRVRIVVVMAISVSFRDRHFVFRWI
jgi:hypothetical protein